VSLKNQRKVMQGHNRVLKDFLKKGDLELTETRLLYLYDHKKTSNKAKKYFISSLAFPKLPPKVKLSKIV